MIIGIPRETGRLEHRVGLTPFAVSRLSSVGHTVLVERDAGTAAHFADQDYSAVGGEIVYSAEEIYGRSDLISRVGRVSGEDLELLKPGAIVCGFQHLAVSPRETLDRLARLEASLIGYEIIEDSSGDRPVLLGTSDLAGQLAVHEAAHYLQIQHGGRGILLGNTPGVPPATVLVLGAGAVGTAAARTALANGAHVIVTDMDARKLRRLVGAVGDRVVTALATPSHLARFIAVSDAIIGAILIPGGRAPWLVTEEMVKSMKPGCVIIDVSIDQGGCVETSRPTTLDSPTFTKHGVVHYCVPNMTSNIARTASRVLTIAAMPYIEKIAELGLDRALLGEPGLASGVYMYQGRLVNEAVARICRTEPTSLESLIGGRR